LLPEKIFEVADRHGWQLAEIHSAATEGLWCPMEAPGLTGNSLTSKYSCSIYPTPEEASKKQRK
jgi:hypothetical protein